MGRKPNPVIAEHFIRGAKHGVTTNRYSQTCSHCNLVFPTGRPETLYAHLANCPGLTQSERALVLGQIYNNSSSTSAVDLGIGTSSRSHDPVSAISHPDDFDITGLNVLAGVAENAEDMVIDPQITASESAIHVSAAENQPMTFYDSNFGHPFPHNVTNHPWTFQIPTTHDSPPSFHDVQTVTTATSPFSSATSPILPQWAFAPVVTTPATYIAHPTQGIPIAFASEHENAFAHENSGIDIPPVFEPYGAKTRKAREPYNEPKRARVAEMRQIGVCIRCSRLRKTCEPSRPCSACSKTNSKTWVGGCTTLNKGQEFNVWFNRHFSQTFDILSEAMKRDSSSDSEDASQLKLVYFGDNGSELTFDLTKVHAENTPGHDENMCDQVNGSVELYLIDEREDITSKLLKHVSENQDLIIEAIEIPALYTTVRIVQGLSSKRDLIDEQLTWGTAAQSDARLSNILDLWLLIALITSDIFDPVWTAVGPNGEQLEEVALQASSSIIVAQIHTGLETAIKHNKDEFRRLDSNILNQSYKHMFNLVMGMVLVLDMVERYCCFMKRQEFPFDIDEDKMFEQAEALAYKYAYCIQNIQMMPEVSFNVSTGMLEASSDGGRVNHEMQRLWLADLYVSEDDLECYLGVQEESGWDKPRGRLWARLFRKLNNQ